jgi:hypothetical protein
MVRTDFSSVNTHTPFCCYEIPVQINDPLDSTRRRRRNHSMAGSHTWYYSPVAGVRVRVRVRLLGLGLGLGLGLEELGLGLGLGLWLGLGFRVRVRAPC